ncbi:MAG TPA: hypothetical protein VIW64_09125 [Pyrinomonadaceae bacterium]|jgi:WD40 repeat protein
MNNSFTRFSTQNSEAVLSLDVHEEGKSLAVGQHDDYESKRVLSLWSLPELQLVTTLVESGQCLAARFVRGGPWLAYSDHDQNMVLHDLNTGIGNREAFPLTFTKWISAAWNSPRVIAGGTRTQVWDADSNAVIWTLPIEPLPEDAGITPPACAISADGLLVAASGVEPGRIVIYEISSGKVIKRIENTMDAARSVAFDPSGRFVAAVAIRGGAGLWELEGGTARLPEMLDMRADYYWCVRFHPDGRRVALGLMSGFVEVIEIETGAYSVNLETAPHLGRVRDLAITRDGKQMFTGADDGAILIWELE